MPDSEEVERFRAANVAIAGMMSADLGAVWATLDLSRPSAARNVLLETVPGLTTMHGEFSAAIAADWYDELRAIERIPGRFRAQLANPVPTEVVEQRVRYGARHLWTENPEQTRVFLDNATSEYALQPGRDTIQQSSIADPNSPGWHRETRPSDSYASGCGFCRMLAGRGGVFKRGTAKFSAHGGCHCVAMPSWDADAPEVPAEAYQASERMDSIRNRAAAGDASAQRQLDAHRASIRDYVAQHYS